MRKATVTSGGGPGVARPTLGGETRISVVQFNIHADLVRRNIGLIGMAGLDLPAKSRLNRDINLY